jgi:hypothetical protein
MDAAEADGSKAPTAEELRATAGVLHRVLAEIDAGRLPADLDHAAYLRGAMDILSMLPEGPSRNQGIGRRAARRDR